MRLSQMVRDVTASAEIGKTYLGKVVRLAEFGAFVELFPGTDGLLHISEISEHRIRDVRDELKLGDQVLVKVLSIEGNKVRLSRKALIKEAREKQAKAAGGGAAQPATSRTWRRWTRLRRRIRARVRPNRITLGRGTALPCPSSSYPTPIEIKRPRDVPGAFAFPFRCSGAVHLPQAGTLRQSTCPSSPRRTSCHAPRPVRPTTHPVLHSLSPESPRRCRRRALRASPAMLHGGLCRLLHAP